MVSTLITAATTDATMTDSALVIISVIALIALLIQKEIVSGSISASGVRLGRALDIAIIPLIIVLVASLIARSLGVLQ